MHCPFHELRSAGCTYCYPHAWQQQGATGGLAGGLASRDRLSLPHIEADEDFSAVMSDCDRILAVKGRDYTQGEGRLKNFYRNGEKLGLPARKVLAVYLGKHLDAIETYLKEGRVESEPIEGRICDAINYLLLLAKMVRAENRKQSEGACMDVGKVQR